MPLYHYVCADCRFNVEDIEPINAPRQTLCPKCGGINLKLQIGEGLDFHWKGSGWTNPRGRPMIDPNDVRDAHLLPKPTPR